MKTSIKTLALLIFMVLAAGLGVALKPRISMADERPPIVLQAMVPTTFGEWREEPNVTAQVINPQQQSVIDKIYSQTLSRTYLNSKGYRVMLSIAYGKNQSDALSLHKPEVCYPAQGFSLLGKEAVSLELQGGTISATRIETSLGQRNEPVTYWTVVGDRIVTTNLSKKLAEIHYSMQDRVPDGMLFRISSIDKDTPSAYATQAHFAQEIAAAIDPKNRARFIGDPTQN